jgi:IS1 family transposase
MNQQEEYKPVKWCALSAYTEKYIPPDRHRTGKERTWKTERKNLNFRTHLKQLNRKTICFSKNEQIHDNVIGMYIEKYYYKTGTYGNNSF